MTARELYKIGDVVRPSAYGLETIFKPSKRNDKRRRLGSDWRAKVVGFSVHPNRVRVVALGSKCKNNSSASRFHMDFLEPDVVR